MTRDEPCAQFDMVQREIWMTQVTVAENIAYDRPDATREEIIAAAKAAYAYESQLACMD